MSPIEAAIANAEQVRRRAVVAAEGSPLEAEKNEPIKRHIFTDRAAPSGKIRWSAELGAVIKAIEEMEKAPPAVAAMLPLLRDAQAQLKAAQPLPVGHFASPFVYSGEAVTAVLAVELAVGDFRSWAASAANAARYAAILRASSPKRATDPKPGAPEQGTQPASPGAETPPAAPAQDAAAAPPAATASEPSAAPATV